MRAVLGPSYGICVCAAVFPHASQHPKEEVLARSVEEEEGVWVPE